MSLVSSLTSFVDACVEAYSPRLGAARMQARQVLARVRDRQSDPQASCDAGGTAYEGAANDTQHGHNWMTSRLSADSALELGMTQEELRQRSRDMYRNSDIGGAIDARVDLVVGTGFTLQAKIKATPGFCDDTQAREWAKQIEDVATEWAYTADVDGKTSLWECSRLVERHHAFDGESFTVWSDVSSIDKEIPLAIEIIDPDRVQTPPEKISDPLCRMGVQKDQRGRIIGYWIRNKHPGETRDIDLSLQFVPAERVLHVFEKWFAGQSRGLPWLTRALRRILDGKDLDEAGIIAAQVEACYAGFITKASPGEIGPNGLATKEATSTANGIRIKDLQPGTVRYMDPGEQITFGSPGKGRSIVTPLQEQNYRRIAGALNMAYEMLARDWRGVSFAGGRIILSGTKLDTRARQRRMKDSWFRPLYHRLVDECVIVGAVDIPADLYSRRPRVFRRHRWVAPAWPYSITPGEEIDAALKAVDGNLTTVADQCAELYGNDFEDVAEEREFERSTERTKQIVPTKTAQVESPQGISPQDAEKQTTAA